MDESQRGLDGAARFARGIGDDSNDAQQRTHIGECYIAFAVWNLLTQWDIALKITSPRAEPRDL
jgi:hypothetical protein